MLSSNFQVRRATVDDLVVLRRLWQQAQLPAAILEKRLTEFQIAESAVGEIFGALGVQIAGSQGRIHSEAYSTPELAEELQPRLWDRVLSLARHQGLHRLWVQNELALYWVEQGFEVPSAELLRKLPAAFSDGQPVSWLTFMLREESLAATTVEQEWNLFRQNQQAENASLIRRARALRVLAAVITVAALVLMVCAIGYLVLRRGAVR